MTSASMKSQLTRTRRMFGDKLAGFTAWWFEELCALMPVSWQVALASDARRLFVEVESACARVILEQDEARRELVRLVLTEGRWPDETALAAAVAAHPREVVVRVAPGQVLVRRLSFPLAAQENLRQVLAFEMDRNTPFKSEQVYFGYAIVERDTQQNKLQVRLTLIPRNTIDPLLSLLERSGLAATSLTVRGDGSGEHAPQLLPAPRRSRIAPGKSAHRRRWLACAAALLLAVAVVVPLVQKQRVVSRLEEQVRAAREIAMEAERVRDELQRQLAESNVVVDRRNERPFAIQVLDEVTRLLPDSTWLTRVEIAGETVKLQGESANASEVATLMMASTLFSDAQFDSPVTRDLHTQQERFVISAKLKEAPKK